MPITSAKRKLSLEERIAKTKQRQVEARLASPDVRRHRLIAIQKRMKMSHPKFREMLGMTEQHWRSVRYGTQPVVLGIVKLAEIELQRFLAREKRQAPELQDIPQEYKDDPELQKSIMLKHFSGSAPEVIAAELAVRIDVVNFYLAKLD